MPYATICCSMSIGHLCKVARERSNDAGYSDVRRPILVDPKLRLVCDII